jgi:hypothetical protein
MKNTTCDHLIILIDKSKEVSHRSLIFWSLITLMGCMPFNTPTNLPSAEIPASSPSPATVTQTSFSTFENLPTPQLFDIFWDDQSVFRIGLTPYSQEMVNAQPGASIYQIDLEVAESLLEVNGKAEILYTNRENKPLDELLLRLFPNILGGKMVIKSSQLNGMDVTPSYGLENSLLQIPLDPPLVPGDKAVISMQFEVSVPGDLDANYGVFSAADDVLAYAHGYPMISVYNDKGWNAEIPSPSGDVTINDASFYIVRITAPRDLTIVASGSEMEHKIENDKQQVTYVLGPARDFYFVASNNYKKTTIKANGVVVNIYTPASNQLSADSSLQVASEALRIFSDRYAPYPYSELDLVTTPTLALGIEYPGIIAMTEKIMVPSGNINNTPVSNYLESTVAHEVGHQWFYNMVGNDQLNDPWLDESLTQFATLQYFSDRYGLIGAKGFRKSLENRWSRVQMAEIPIGLPVRDYTDDEYGAIVYGRGGLFFEALRDKMGQKSFDEFLKDYSISLSWDIASVDKFKALAEQHCKCKLDALFREWVYP